MNFQEVVSSVKTLLGQWKQHQRNGIQDIPTLATDNHLPEGSRGGSNKVSVDVLVQKVGLALQTFLQTKTNDLTPPNYVSFFQQCLYSVTSQDSNLYYSILRYFPPEWSYLSPASASSIAVTQNDCTATTEWKEFEKIVLSLQRKVTMDTKPIFLVPETDTSKLYEAKKLQIQSKSSSFWPFLRSQFTVDTSFFHYADILDKSFQLVQQRYPNSVSQSDVFQAADFIKKEPIFAQANLPSSFGPAFAKTNTLLQRLAAGTDVNNGSNCGLSSSSSLTSSVPNTPKLPAMAAASLYSFSSVPESSKPRGRKKKRKNEDPEEEKQETGKRKPKQSRKSKLKADSTAEQGEGEEEEENKKRAVGYNHEDDDDYPTSTDKKGLETSSSSSLTTIMDEEGLETHPTFEEVAYGIKQEETVEEVGHGYNRRKVFRLANPVLAACPPLQELQQELFAENELRRRSRTEEVDDDSGEVGNHSKMNYTIEELIYEYPYSHGPEIESSFIVDASMISRVVRYLFTKLKEKNIYLAISAKAIEALSQGMQMHLRNIMESASKVHESTDEWKFAGRSKIVLKDVPKQMFPMTIPSFRKPVHFKKTSPDDDDEEEATTCSQKVVLRYDIDVLHAARKRWIDMKEKGIENAGFPVPALPYQKGSIVSHVSRCLFEERMQLLTDAAEITKELKQQQQQQQQEKETSEEQRKWNEGFVYFTESLAQLKSQEEKRQEEAENEVRKSVTSEALKQVILKHSSALFLPAKFRLALIMQKE